MTHDMPSTPSFSKQRILEELENIYQISLQAEQFATALRAKEVQAKILGLLKNKRGLAEGRPFHFDDLSEDEWTSLFDAARKYLAKETPLIPPPKSPDPAPQSVESSTVPGHGSNALTYW